MERMATVRCAAHEDEDLFAQVKEDVRKSGRQALMPLLCSSLDDCSFDSLFMTLPSSASEISRNY